jgi:hypothetical protein
MKLKGCNGDKAEIESKSERKNREGGRTEEYVPRENEGATRTPKTANKQSQRSVEYWIIGEEETK